MKSIRRRALAALVFGFLTLGTGSAIAEQAAEKGRGCCAEETSCCSAACCTETRPASAFDQTAERYKTKYGREYPGRRSAVQTASHSCCKNC